LLWEDESLDGDLVQALLCQQCGAGYVRELACTKHECQHLPMFEERGLNGPFGRNLK
jgi:hypothetical protein